MKVAELQQYLDWGFSVIPIAKGTKKPMMVWKPYQSRKPTLEEIGEWFPGNGVGVGVVCGAVSGNLVVLDFDNHDSYYKFVNTFKEAQGELPHHCTAVVKTPRGYHVYLRVAELPGIHLPDAEHKNNLPDIKSEGSYVVAPPSLHPDGGCYEWVSGVKNILKVDNLRQVGITVPEKSTLPTVNEPGWVAIALQGVATPGRDNTCIKLAGYFKSKGVPKDVTATLLYDFAERCEPPLPEADVRKCVMSSYSYQVQEPPKSEVAEDAYGLTPQRVRDICGTGWLNDYVSWASAHTNAPLAYHLAVGLSLLATAMGNRVWTPAWNHTLYPNLWLCILGPSGIYHKSTCIHMGMKILQADVGLAGRVYPSEWSREKLLQVLEQVPDGLFEWDEFSNMMANLNREYNSGAIALLTRLFDSTAKYARVTGSAGQSAIVSEAAPTIIAASTLDWLQERVRAGDLRGGFFSRFLFVPGVEHEAEPEFDRAFDREKEAHLTGWLTDLYGFRGQASFDQVRLPFREWVRGHEGAAADVAPELMGFYARRETYLLKLGMALAAAESVNDIVITPDVLRRTTLLLDSIKECVISTVGCLSLSKEGAQLDNLKKFLKKNSPVTTRDCLRKMHWTKRNFEPMLQTLEMTGEVSVETVETGGRPSRQLVWRG